MRVYLSVLWIPLSRYVFIRFVISYENHQLNLMFLSAMVIFWSPVMSPMWFLTFLKLNWTRFITGSFKSDFSSHLTSYYFCICRLKNSPMSTSMTGSWRTKTFVMYQNGCFLSREEEEELNYQVLMIPNHSTNHLKG